MNDDFVNFLSSHYSRSFIHCLLHPPSHPHHTSVHPSILFVDYSQWKILDLVKEFRIHTDTMGNNALFRTKVYRPALFNLIRNAVEHDAMVEMVIFTLLAFVGAGQDLSQMVGDHFGEIREGWKGHPVHESGHCFYGVSGMLKSHLLSRYPVCKG